MEQSSASIFLSERKRNRVFDVSLENFSASGRHAWVLGEFLGPNANEIAIFFARRWLPPGPVVTREGVPRLEGPGILSISLFALVEPRRYEGKR